MDLATLQAFEAEIKKHVPTFKIAYKDETPWMRVLGFLATPFNQGFMTKYTTTLGQTVYFPSRAYYEGQPKASFNVLAHEFVHMQDSVKYPGWYHLSYMLPQILSPVVLFFYAMLVPWGWAAVMALLLAVVLGCVAAQRSVAAFFLVAGTLLAGAVALSVLLTHWWAALFIGGLGLLTPLPSPGRVRWELRGYTMTLAILVWTYGPPPDVVRDMVARHFYGPDYFYMSWSRAQTLATLDAAIVCAQDGSLQKTDSYSIVYAFLEQHRALRGM